MVYAGTEPLAALFVAFFFVFFTVALAVYIYTSLAYMSIAKKAKQKSPGLAWIPFFGPLIIAFQSSKMHWWPWLLLIGIFIPFIGIIAQLVFLVYVIIWNWKLFEAVKRPGWLSILLLIPLVNFVIIGIVAWSRD